MAFTNNFSTSFRWWDRIFGTDEKYRQYRERVKAMKKKNVDKEEFAKLEQKLLEQVEREGIVAEREAETGVKAKSQ